MSDIPASGVPEFAPVRLATLRAALALGWRDLRRAKRFALVLAGVYVAAGLALSWITRATGQSFWLVLAAVGFPLVGPFAAVGFYEISRRLARGEAPGWRQVFGVILRQSQRQLPSLCAVIVLVFLFWFFLGHMIFALFLGLAPMTNISSSPEVFLSVNGLMMLGTGTLVGAGFAVLLYTITVLALPLLLDREVDFVTAMIVSVQYVLAHPVLMLAWGALLAGLTFLALLPGFLGLFLVLPWLGHASWHLYALLRGADPA